MNILKRVYSNGVAFYVYSRAKLLSHRDDLDTIDRHSRSGFSDPGAHTALMPRSALPRISLPNFSGEYQSWRPIYDLFSSIIRDNTELSNVEKMHYLKTCLTGEASRLVSNLPVSGENFMITWNMLISRYENKRFFISAQLDRLTSLKPMKTKSAQSLSIFFSTVTETIGALRALGCVVHHWDPLLLHQLFKLLDSGTRQAWEICLGSSSDSPTFAQFEDFIIGRTRAIENLNLPGSTSHKECSYSFFGGSRFKTAAHVVTPSSSQGTPKCPLCDEFHYLAKCNRYQSTTPSQRREIIIKH